MAQDLSEAAKGTDDTLMNIKQTIEPRPGLLAFLWHKKEDMVGCHAVQHEDLKVVMTHVTRRTCVLV